MSVLKINSRYVDAHGKEFVVMQEQDDMVWYAHKDITYCCRTEAFLERFKLVENHT
jgi:hypothetical protein